MGLLDDTLQRWGLGLLNGGVAPMPTTAAQPAPFGFAPGPAASPTAEDMIRQARAQLAEQQRSPPPIADIGPPEVSNGPQLSLSGAGKLLNRGIDATIGTLGRGV